MKSFEDILSQYTYGMHDSYVLKQKNNLDLSIDSYHSLNIK